ncbi:MAG: polysaccharide deacetylase family protein [Clostridia bacterium]|nr:polysaccharide deacetylase family protein [Clostridia bacterium]
MTTKMKNQLITLSLVLLVVVFAGVSAWLDHKVQPVAARLDLPIYSVELPPEKKQVALTFDAAWGNEDTGTLIDILGRYGVKATFFVVGQWAEKYPESVQALHDAGHDIMNHSYDHRHYTELSSADMVKDAHRASEAIRKVTGIRTNLFRPPYGDYNASVVESLRNAGYFTIQWDVDSLDWKDLSASEITKRVLGGVKNGSIVLFHNAALHTPEALPGIIASLQEQGYELVKVSDMIYKNQYTMDHTGRQQPLPEA